MMQQVHLRRRSSQYDQFIDCCVEWPKKLKVGQKLTLKEYGEDLWTVIDCFRISPDHKIQSTWTGSNKTHSKK